MAEVDLLNRNAYIHWTNGFLSCFCSFGDAWFFYFWPLVFSLALSYERAFKRMYSLYVPCILTRLPIYLHLCMCVSVCVCMYASLSICCMHMSVYACTSGWLVVYFIVSNLSFRLYCLLSSFVYQKKKSLSVSFNDC